MSYFLRNYPNLNVVYCENDNEAYGAIEAYLTGGKVETATSKGIITIKKGSEDDPSDKADHEIDENSENTEESDIDMGDESAEAEDKTPTIVIR